MGPRSIRARITLASTALSTTVMVVVSILLVWLLRHQLGDNLDEGLAERADAIARALPGGAGDFGGGEGDVVVQVLDGQARIVEASPGLASNGPIAPLRPGYRTIDDVPGRTETFRVLVRPLDVGEARWLLVGVDHDDVTDPVGTMVGLLAGIVPVVVAVLGALTWWLTGRTLRPVERMRTEMAQITAADLDRRIDPPATRDEVARLALTMNATLDRLEDAVRRQQRFVADASHELRGPLTRMRSDLEVDLHRPELADPIATERRVLDEAIAMQQLVEDLLHLARSDAGAASTTRVAVDVDDLVLHEARRLAERGRVDVDARLVSAAQVDGDRDQLRRAIRNLLDNAERHAATSVSISLEEADGVARLIVGNDGATIPADQRERIFERFTRLDEARTRDAGGSGLGLAISRDIIERHRGTVRLADELTTRFIVELPARV